LSIKGAIVKTVNRRHFLGQSGFTILEAMMALMVLSFGLLGTAAMQDVALSRNVDANQLTLTTNLAVEMIERIRFNNKNVAVYSGIDTQNSATRPPSSQPMARGDYDQWQSRLVASGLTSARGRVTVSAIGPTNLTQSQVTVQVTWAGTVLSHSVSMGTIIAPE
jgi:type IV pilus assembly protein PilV